MRTSHRSWSDLTRSQRVLVLVGAVVEVGLTTYAARDLIGRDAESVRGPRAGWAAALIVQPFGPIAYLALGRR